MPTTCCRRRRSRCSCVPRAASRSSSRSSPPASAPPARPGRPAGASRCAVRAPPAGGRADGRRFPTKPLGGRRLELITRHAAAFVCLSREVEDELAAHGVPRDRLRRIPNGVDAERFRPPRNGERAAARSRLGLPADGLVLAYCGRFAEIKRVDVLLEAFARVDHAHLLLVGEGPEEPAVREAIRAGGLAGRVRMVPTVDDTAPVLRAADAYVSASITEGMSNAVLEAMATALPVFASPASGMAELLGTEDGLLAEGDGADALAAALRRAPDGELRARAGARLREVVQARYSLE